MTEGEITGKVKEGHKIASGLNDLPPDEKINATIRKQKPFFERVVPGISDVYDGTVNVDISPRTFEILRHDHEVTCEWEEGIKETFWFVRASLSHKNRLYRGWIYYPCPGPLKKHANDAFEFLAPWIEDLRYGDIVSVKYPTNQVKIKQLK